MDFALLRALAVPPPPPLVITHNRGDDWIHAVPRDVEDRDKPLKDISKQAVWTLSTCQKGGFGVHELLDDSPDKMWQSDGKLPHTVTIEFQRKTDVCFLFLFLDFNNDESYTPARIRFSNGSSVFSQKDLVDYNYETLTGWVLYDLRTMGFDKEGEVEMKPSRLWVIQAQVIANHQNGTNSHIRHMRVIGPDKSRLNTKCLTAAELECNVPADTDDLNQKAIFKEYHIR